MTILHLNDRNILFTGEIDITNSELYIVTPPYYQNQISECHYFTASKMYKPVLTVCPTVSVPTVKQYVLSKHTDRQVTEVTKLSLFNSKLLKNVDHLVSRSETIYLWLNSLKSHRVPTNK
jgi:hypothetical protein